MIENMIRNSGELVDISKLCAVGMKDFKIIFHLLAFFEQGVSPLQNRESDLPSAPIPDNREPGTVKIISPEIIMALVTHTVSAKDYRPTRAGGACVLRPEAIGQVGGRPCPTGVIIVVGSRIAPTELATSLKTSFFVGALLEGC
ncbi:hypothetical protein LSTR_LSTR003751 [Laodelphax striatellus]|uniref:Uncharacterized protein n=1 Tax=Laodelphax striatellus TaxID=195883 RepID=A0A482WQ55_LAOST|nr:hypothetical protein LSTR_LSTR003751 [Laodelphax striatellus]